MPPPLAPPLGLCGGFEADVGGSTGINIGSLTESVESIISASGNNRFC